MVAFELTVPNSEYILFELKLPLMWKIFIHNLDFHSLIMSSSHISDIS